MAWNYKVFRGQFSPARPFFGRFFALLRKIAPLTRLAGFAEAVQV
jgi:hypothetical protein